jgi:hypothetical protein
MLYTMRSASHFRGKVTVRQYTTLLYMETQVGQMKQIQMAGGRVGSLTICGLKSGCTNSFSSSAYIS